MARPKQFSELPFLDDITVTDFLLGRGSYGTVHIANYGGIKCAAKKPHGFFYSFSNGNQHKDAVVRFREECNCMSEMNHPNIVHFWGMYQATDEPGPMLILEYHPTNVATLIDRFGKPLPDELAFSLLRGVAKALKYLHGRSVPIIHRDLTANNVLVSSNLQPKVSDFGMSARFLQAGADNMTQAPGNLTYMPPESLCQNPQYNTKIDIFSFGVLAMHMLSGEWPTPHSSAVHAHPGGLEAISEITRRKHYLDKIGSEHALMGMILQCIHNDPQQREEAAVIVRQMEEITTRFPMSSELESHWVAVLKQIESDGDTQTESPIETQQEPDTVDSLNENHNQNAEQSNVELQVNHSYDESPLDNVTEMQVELPAKFAHFFDSDGRCHKSEHLSLSDVLESMPSNQLSLHNMPEQIVGLIDTTHIPDFSNTVKVQIAFMRFLEISQQPHSVLFTSTCLALTGSNTGQTPLEASVDQAVAKAIPSYVANLGREVSESTTSSLAFPTTHESPASPRNDSTVAVMLLESPPQKCDLKVSVSEALVSISSTQGQIQILNNHTVIPASLENFRPPPNAWENRLISLLCQVFSKKQLHNLLKLANTPHNNVTNMVYKLANTHDNASIDILCIVNEEGNVTICFSQQSTIHELTVAMVLSSPPVVAKSHLSSGNKAVVITANADRATSYPANTNTETRCRTANMSTNKHENGGHSTTVSLSSRYHSGFAQESDKMNFPYTDVAIVNKEREETPYHNGGKDPMRYQDDSPLASHASNPLNKRGNSLSSLMSGCVLQDRLQLINMHLNRYLRRNGLMPYSPRMLIEEIVVKSTDPQHLKSQVTQSLTQCKGIVGLPRKTLYSYNKAKIESGQHTSQSIDNQPQTIRDTVRVKKKANTPPKVKTQLKSSALNRTKEKPLHSPKAPPLKLSVCNTVKKKRHSSLKSSTQLRSSGHDQLSVTGCDQMPTDQTQRISERPVVHKRNGSKKQPQKRVYKRKKKKKTSSLPETFNFAAHGEETGEVTSTLSTLSSLKSRLWFVPYQNVKKRAWWTKPVLKRLSRLKKKQTPSSNTLASMELLCKIPTGRKTPWKKRAPEIWRQRKRPPRAIKSSYYCAAYSPTCLLNSRRQSFRVEIGKMFSSKVKKRKKLLPISLPSTSTDHMNCDLSSNKDVDERHSVQDSNPLLSSSSLFAADSYRSTYNITTLQQYHDVAGFQSMCNGDVGTYVMCTKSDGGKMSLQGYNVSKNVSSSQLAERVDSKRRDEASFDGNFHGNGSYSGDDENSDHSDTGKSTYRHIKQKRRKKKKAIARSKTLPPPNAACFRNIGDSSCAEVHQQQSQQYIPAGVVIVSGRATLIRPSVARRVASESTNYLCVKPMKPEARSEDRDLELDARSDGGHPEARSDEEELEADAQLGCNPTLSEKDRVVTQPIGDGHCAAVMCNLTFPTPSSSFITNHDSGLGTSSVTNEETSTINLSRPKDVGGVQDHPVGYPPRQHRVHVQALQKAHLEFERAQHDEDHPLLVTLHKWHRGRAPRMPKLPGVVLSVSQVAQRPRRPVPHIASLVHSGGSLAASPPCQLQSSLASSGFSTTLKVFVALAESSSVTTVDSSCHYPAANGPPPALILPRHALRVRPLAPVVNTAPVLHESSNAVFFNASVEENTGELCTLGP